jgi:hypothetical protein
VVSLLAASVLSFTAAIAPATAGTALVVGGVGQPTLPDWVMSNLLGGRFVDDVREDIYWPAEAKPFTPGSRTLGQSVAVGTDNLYAAILSSEEPITVVGMSGGSLVVDETLRRLLANPDAAPSPDSVTFVIIADSSRQQFINRTKYSSRLDYTYQPAPETQYDIIVVTGEYDGFADFPDRWWNFTAVLNAYAGVLTEHIPTAFADLDNVPLKNITVTVNSVGGTTTHYLVPAATLPLVKLFPHLKGREEALKRQIDSAYKRNDVPAANRASLASAPAVSGEATDSKVEEKAESVAKAPGRSTADPAPVAEIVVDETEAVETEAVETEAVEADVETDVEADVEADLEASEDAEEDASSKLEEDADTESETAGDDDDSESRSADDGSTTNSSSNGGGDASE